MYTNSRIATIFRRTPRGLATVRTFEYNQRCVVCDSVITHHTHNVCYDFNDRPSISLCPVCAHFFTEQINSVIASNATNKFRKALDEFNERTKNSSKSYFE